MGYDSSGKCMPSKLEVLPLNPTTITTTSPPKMGKCQNKLEMHLSESDTSLHTDNKVILYV
jgi:hypothetical protein